LVSSACLQSGKRPQFFHPRLRKRSANQSLFWKENHAWFFTFGGAQALQMIFFMGDSTRLLHVLSRLHGILPIICELPSDFILHILE
jgi:hypothetical protein